jgi:hypothetical protein
MHGSRIFLAGLLAVVGSCALAAQAHARTRTFCGVVKRACGGQLEPACTSGSACDAGYHTYSGSPFPITINCPWPIKDVTVKSGCYKDVPSCDDCSAAGQIPCPSEASAYCPVGCDAGLVEDSLTHLCKEPGTIGLPEVGPNESCFPGVAHCQSGLQCTLALLCSHVPAQEGETCDATAPCADGLYCQAGVPQVCRRKRTVGEGCSAFNPCAAGLSCEPCYTSRCNALQQCFPNANQGAITEQECRTLYSPVLAQGAKNGDVTLTWAGGNGIAAVASESQAFGVAYGQNDEYGCYTSLCYGVTTDIAIEGAFTSIGLYTSFDAVGGTSFVNTQSAQTPFKLLNFSTSQVFQRFGDGFPPVTGDLIGTEDALGVGGGLNPSPFTSGSLYCDTVLDPVTVDPGTGAPPPVSFPPLETILNPDFASDLFGWTCTNGGVCGWDWDAPGAPAIYGSGRVTSPPPGSLTDTGRLESSCVAVQEGFSYRTVAFLKTTGAMPGQAYVIWSSDPACNGGALGSEVVGISPPDGVWREFVAEEVAPPGARSLKLKATAQRDVTTDAPSSTYIDDVYVPEPSAALCGLGAAAALLALARRRSGRR